jgi:CRISPR system Cascade subunit CasD
MNTVFLRLEAPLQAWGTRGRFQERDTASEPTKSGIIGLIACALGWGLDREADIAGLGDDLQLGVRVDVPGHILRDYHTVSGGVRSAEGKIKITASTRHVETIVSHRSYLSDASFLAAVMGSEEHIAQVADALQHPVWPPFLGRRSCPPSAPLFAGTGAHASLAEALASQPRHPRSGDGPIRAVIEASPVEGFVRLDRIASLRARTYLPRFARELFLTPEAPR